MLIDQRSLLNLRKAADFVLLNIAFFAAAVIAQPFKELLSNELLFILLLLQNILWYFSSSLLAAYSDFNYRSFSVQVITLSKMTILEAAFTIFFLFFIKEDLFTRNFVGFYTILLFLTILIKEYGIWISQKRLRQKGTNLRNLLIIGSNNLSKLFREQIDNELELGFRFTGYVDDKDSDDEEILGKFDELEQIIGKHEITDIVYSHSFEESGLLNKVIRICDKHAVKLTILPQLTQFSTSNIELDFLGKFPVIKFRRNRLEEVQWRITKRIFDIAFTSILFILVLAWVYLVIAAAIKLNSKGRVFYIQKRIGRHSREFNCLKFRTMRESDKEKEGIHDDSHRVTAVGKVLRKYSLDEIPQFINVLKGEMSVVGPRPHPVSYSQQYTEMVEAIKLRHRVKPGITGWAQIHGLRGDYLDFERNKEWLKKRIDFDNWYIENWSLKLDVQIIIETVWQVISRKNLGE